MNRFFIMGLFLLSFTFSLNAQSKIKIAILNFSAKGTDPALAEAVQENFTTSLVSTGYYEILERSQLDQLTRELKLQNTDDFSDETRLKLGKLSGASQLLLGSITRIGQQITMNIRIVEVESGVIRFADKFTTKRENDIPGLLDDMALRVKQNQENIVRRTVAVYPFYNVSKNNEYSFLSVTIGDVIRSALSGKNQFNLTSIREVEKEIQGIEPANLNDLDFIIPLTLKIKSDAAVTGSYSINNGKILITANIVNILTGEITSTVSVDGNENSDIFGLSKELAVLIADRMTHDYPVMSRNVIAMMLEEKNRSEAIKIRELENELKRKALELEKEKISLQKKSKENKEFEKQVKEEEKKRLTADEETLKFKQSLEQKRLEDNLHTGGYVMIGFGGTFLAGGLVMLIVDLGYAGPEVVKSQNLYLTQIEYDYNNYKKTYETHIGLFSTSIVFLSLGVVSTAVSLPLMLYKSKKQSVTLFVEPGINDRIGLSIRF